MKLRRYKKYLIVDVRLCKLEHKWAVYGVADSCFKTLHEAKSFIKSGCAK